MENPKEEDVELHESKNKILKYVGSEERKKFGERRDCHSHKVRDKLVR